MFDIGWGELVVIGIVALIAIGPKELPGVLRSLGQWMAKIKRMAAEFQGQFQEAMREAEMADLKQHVDDLNSAASSVSNFDPLASAQKEMESAVNQPVSKPATTPAAGATPAAEKPVELVPAVDVTVPLPESPPAVTEQDFAPAKPSPPQEAGGGRAA